MQIIQLIHMEVGGVASATLTRDIEQLELSLAAGGEEVAVSLSRETAEFVTQIVKAKAAGQEVIMTKGLDEVTPSEAGLILGMSRPQVRKLMERGALPFRMVGSHHRIQVADITRFRDAERARRREAMRRFTDLENELGLGW